MLATAVIALSLAVSGSLSIPVSMLKQRGLDGAGEATRQNFETDTSLTSQGKCALPAEQITGGFAMMASIPLMSSEETDCTKCIMITNADDPSKFGYAFVVDERTDSDGIDLSDSLFEQIAIDPLNPIPNVRWAPADPSNCAAISWTGICNSPVTHPTYCS